VTQVSVSVFHNSFSTLAPEISDLIWQTSQIHSPFWFQQVDTLVFIGYSSNKREDTCHFILRFLFHFCFFNNSHFIIKLNWSIYLGYNQDSIEKNSTGVWENFKQCNSACDLLGISIFKWSKLLPFLLIYVSTCTGPLILKRIWLLWLILKNFFNLPLELY